MTIYLIPVVVGLLACPIIRINALYVLLGLCLMGLWIATGAAL